MFIPPAETSIHRLRLYLRRRRAHTLRRRAMAEPFAGRGQRLLLVTEPERIPQSQIFPFHHYADDLRRLYGAEVREADLGAVLKGRVPPATGATVVAFQTPFDIPDADLSRLVSALKAQNPGARLVCLDWFAPTDLRNAARMDPLVDVYVKKHLLRDRTRYGLPTRGDTNLTDYYNRRYGLDEPERCFALPPGFGQKLVLGPSFATAPLILPALLGRRPRGARPIDLHARFATGGTPWYAGMRAESEAAVERLRRRAGGSIWSGWREAGARFATLGPSRSKPGAKVRAGAPGRLKVLAGGAVPLPRFMVELARSKLCFSPFGYGEVCWRDYEAIAAGAVLLKQDMGHVATDPDVFVPWETYVPLRWDLEDFEDTVRRLAADAALRERIADAAFGVLRDWLASDAFARAMAPLFVPGSQLDSEGRDSQGRERLDPAERVNEFETGAQRFLCRKRGMRQLDCIIAGAGMGV